MSKDRPSKAKDQPGKAATDEEPTPEVNSQGPQWGVSGSAGRNNKVQVGPGTKLPRGRPKKEDWRNLKITLDGPAPKMSDVLRDQIESFADPHVVKELRGLPKLSEPVVRRTVRMSASLFDAMKQGAVSAGLSLEEWMRRQFINGLAKGEALPVAAAGSSPKVPRRFAGLSTSEKSPKKQVALRLEDELLAAVEEAVRASGALKNDWLRAAIIKALDEGLDVRAVLESPPQGQD